MTNSKSKSEVLSETTKSEIRKIAKQDFYGYHTEFKTKPMMKGTDWEQIVEAHGNKLKKSKDEGNYEYWFSGEDYYNKTFKNTEQ